MNADSIRITSDEDGFHLIVQSADVPAWGNADRATFDFNIHGVAVELLREVERAIGPWMREGEAVRHAFLCNPDESGGYDTSDPKHPDFHSIHADIWDAREGK